MYRIVFGVLSLFLMSEDTYPTVAHRWTEKGRTSSRQEVQRVMEEQSNHKYHDYRRLDDFEEKNMLPKNVPLHYQLRMEDRSNKLKVRGKIFNLDNTSPIDLSHTFCSHDGIKEKVCSLPRPVRRGTNFDGDTYIVKHDAETGTIVTALIIFIDGGIVQLVNLDDETGIYASITVENFDPDKVANAFTPVLGIDVPDFRRPPAKMDAARFGNDEVPASHRRPGGDHHRQNRIRGLSEENMAVENNNLPLRKLPEKNVDINSSSCTEYRNLEIAIAYDSTFCGAFPTVEEADSKVFEIIAAVSAIYELPGVCIKVHLTNLESNCDPDKDPYAVVVSQEHSGCRYGQYGMIDAFQTFWNKERRSVHRDVAHLFVGTPLECSKDDPTQCLAGCALLNTWCDLNFSYGIDHVTKSESWLFQTILVTHELGRTGGAKNVVDVGVVMYPKTTTPMTKEADKERWSAMSVSSIIARVDDTACVDYCTSDDDCDDGDACNGIETCDVYSGLCNYGQYKDCDDGYFCNGMEVCDPLTGNCLAASKQKASSSDICDDNIGCNGVEVCNEIEGTCAAGKPVCDEVRLEFSDAPDEGPIINGYYFDLTANNHATVLLKSIQVTTVGDGDLVLYKFDDLGEGRQSSPDGWMEIFSRQVSSDSLALLKLDPPISIRAGESVGMALYSSGGIVPAPYEGEYFDVNRKASSFDLTVTHALPVPSLFSDLYYPPMDPNAMVITYTTNDVVAASAFIMDREKSTSSQGNVISASSPTPAPSCNNDEINVSIQVTTDDSPEEISWRILQGTNAMYTSEVYTRKDAIYVEHICLPHGTIYSFQYFDADGKAGTADSPRGFGLTVDGDTVSESGNSLAGGISTLFGECETSSGTSKFVLDLVTDAAGQETSWYVTEAYGNNDNFSLGENNLQANHMPYQYADCLDSSLCYSFTISDSNGICCDNGEGSYSLMYDDNIVVNFGGQFQQNETHYFGNNCPSPLPRSPISTAEITPILTGSLNAFQSPSASPSAFPVDSNPFPQWNSCSNNDYDVHVKITTDDNPHDISWQFLQGTSIMASGGGFSNSCREYSEHLCLPVGSTYLFEIYDKEGNDINSPVSLEIDFNDGEKVTNIASFGRQFKDIFGECSANQGPFSVELKTDNIGGETSFVLVNDQGITLIEQPGPLQNSMEYKYIYCLDISNHCYTFTIMDSFGDGICCNNGQGSYSIAFQNEIVGQGGDFSFSESVTFGEKCV